MLLFLYCYWCCFVLALVNKLSRSIILSLPVVVVVTVVVVGGGGGGVEAVGAVGAVGVVGVVGVVALVVIVIFAVVVSRSCSYYVC